MLLIQFVTGVRSAKQRVSLLVPFYVFMVQEAGTQCCCLFVLVSWVVLSEFLFPSLTTGEVLHDFGMFVVVVALWGVGVLGGLRKL